MHFTATYISVDTYTATFKNFNEEIESTKKVYCLRNTITGAITYADDNGNEISGLTITMPNLPTSNVISAGDTFSFMIPLWEEDGSPMMTWDNYSGKYIQAMTCVDGYTYAGWTNDDSTLYNAGSEFTFNNSVKNVEFHICGQIKRTISRNYTTYTLDTTHIKKISTDVKVLPCGGNIGYLIRYDGTKDGVKTEGIGFSYLVGCSNYATRLSRAATQSELMYDDGGGSHVATLLRPYLGTTLTTFSSDNFTIDNNTYDSIDFVDMFYNPAPQASFDVVYTITFK